MSKLKIYADENVNFSIVQGLQARGVIGKRFLYFFWKIQIIFVYVLFDAFWHQILNRLIFADSLADLRGRYVDSSNFENFNSINQIIGNIGEAVIWTGCRNKMADFKQFFKIFPYSKFDK